MKRGQVTYFIIAGLIVLIAVILIFSARLSFLKDVYEEQTNKLIGVPADIKPVEDYVQECLNDVSKTGVDFVLLQGGYYNPNNSIELDLFKVAYWYDNKDISPSLETVQNEISKFINANLNECILTFPYSDYKINLVNPQAQTTIKKDLILITAEYKANIEYKNITFKLSKFNSKLSHDITNIIDSGKKIVDMESNSQDIDIELIESLNYKVDIFPYDDGLIYSLSNNQTTLMFANKIK